MPIPLDTDSEGPRCVESERPIKGRPSLPDSYLMGSLYALVDVLEKSWPQIGWELERIRQTRKTPTLEIMREALEPIRELGNHYILAQLLRTTPKQGTDKEIRTLKRELDRVNVESRETDSALGTQRILCEESRQAVFLATRQGNLQEKAFAEKEDQRRRIKLEQLEKTLSEANQRRDSLQDELRDYETFFTQNEMLNFLRSKRYELTPRNLASALAGMPHMRWRQSIIRSRKLGCKMAVSLNYQVLEAISWVLRRCHPKTTSGAIRCFREAILKPPKRNNASWVHLKGNWPYLKKAIDDHWGHCQFASKLPYEIAASFIRNVNSPTNALDRILSSEDRFES